MVLALLLSIFPVKVNAADLIQISSYTDRTNKLTDLFNSHVESLDVLNARIDDAIDSQSFELIESFVKEVSTLRMNFLEYTQTLQVLINLETSTCSLVFSDVSGTADSFFGKRCMS